MVSKYKAGQKWRCNSGYIYEIIKVDMELLHYNRINSYGVAQPNCCHYTHFDVHFKEGKLWLDTPASRILYERV